MEKTKVLVADDNREFSRIVSQFISAQDEFQVVGIARDGLEALRLIEKKGPYTGFRHYYASFGWFGSFGKTQRIQ